MTTIAYQPITTACFRRAMPGLRMGFDSMAAWDKTSIEFEDHIQKRGVAFRGRIQNRSVSNPEYQAPSFQKVTSRWSPPISPTTTTAPPLRHESLPSRSTPSSSPRIDSAIGTTRGVTPEEESSLDSMLYTASCNGDLPQMSLLLSLGASVHNGTQVKGLYESFKPAKHGHLSPLTGAATHNRIAAAEFLLAHGAEINPHVNESSSAPLLQACRADNLDMARFLLSRNADVNALNCYKSTPLMYAVKYSSPALVALILSYHPQLESLSFLEMTAAHWAVFHGHPEGLAMLLRAGANPDALMADGSSPLHCAAMNGAEDRAGLLLAFGADVQLGDGQGRTAMEIAREYGRKGIVELLLRRRTV